MRRGTPLWAREETESGKKDEEPRTHARAAGDAETAEGEGAGNGKASGTGAPQDAAGGEGTADEGAGSAEDAAPVRSGWTRRRTVAVAVVSVLLLLTGCVLLQRAHALRHTSGAANHALTDAEASERVSGDVSNALARIFSYTPDGIAGTERSAEAALAGKAARQYEALLGRVKEQVRTQHVTLSTQTVRVGVVSLRGDTAHLLVFLDQTARRGKDEATTSAAQLSVTARLSDGLWRIVDLTAR
jgi:Mce-associated membrane protein